MQHAQQWEIHSKLEGSDPLGIMEHRGEIGFQEEDGKIKEEQPQD